MNKWDMGKISKRRYLLRFADSPASGKRIKPTGKWEYPSCLEGGTLKKRTSRSFLGEKKTFSQKAGRERRTGRTLHFCSEVGGGGE